MPGISCQPAPLHLHLQAQHSFRSLVAAKLLPLTTIIVPAIAGAAPGEGGSSNILEPGNRPQIFFRAPTFQSPPRCRARSHSYQACQPPCAGHCRSGCTADIRISDGVVPPASPARILASRLGRFLGRALGQGQRVIYNLAESAYPIYYQADFLGSCRGRGFSVLKNRADKIYSFAPARTCPASAWAARQPAAALLLRPGGALTAGCRAGGGAVPCASDCNGANRCGNAL